MEPRTSTSRRSTGLGVWPSATGCCGGSVASRPAARPLRPLTRCGSGPRATVIKGLIVVGSVPVRCPRVHGGVLPRAATQHPPGPPMAGPIGPGCEARGWGGGTLEQCRATPGFLRGTLGVPTPSPWAWRWRSGVPPVSPRVYRRHPKSPKVVLWSADFALAWGNPALQSARVVHRSGIGKPLGYPTGPHGCLNARHEPKDDDEPSTPSPNLPEVRADGLPSRVACKCGPAGFGACDPGNQTGELRVVTGEELSEWSAAA